MDEKTEKVIEIFKKERQYEENLFGKYSQNEALNTASILVFIKHYVDKALKSYTKDWTSDLPDWLISCKESRQQNTAPVKTYEEVIKIMALAGALLEANTTLDPDEWR